ncbi:MAG TPA: transglycosylase SLT domain-containing protein [Rhizomicrobium sp.]
MSTIDIAHDASIASSRRSFPLLFLAVLTLTTIVTWKHTSNDTLYSNVATSLKQTVVEDTVPAAFKQELALSPKELIARWDPMIEEAAKRFQVPAAWIRAVMRVESGGRTMQENGPITSPVGAMGLMQVMPGTYEEMRQQYGLGNDAYDPHNNVMAGAAYLRWLKAKFGFPAMFAAYNDGPTKFQNHLHTGAALPAETIAYVERVGAILGTGKGERAAAVLATGGKSGQEVHFTEPNGKTFVVDASQVTAIRAPFAGEYVTGVNAVLRIGKKRQGVHEDVIIATALIRKHGGAV